MLLDTRAYGFTFSYPAHDQTVGRCLREYGEFAKVEAALACQLSRDGAFVDVGANIGAIALPVSRHARTVIALEAHRGLAAVLRANVKANGVGNVQVVNVAVGAAPGVARFAMPPLTEARNFGDNAFDADGPWSQEVEVRTLDSLAPPDTRLVKIDVQGFELDVLQGAGQLLASLRPALIVEVGADSPRARSVIRHLMAKGYACYWLFSPFVTRTAERNAPIERFAKGDHNVAAFPAEGPQPRDMQAIDLDAGWPTDISAFPYLRRFGFEVP
jgi:FkbM family methyltransferase